MSAETLFSYFTQCPPEGHLKFQVASQCAPVLKGIKASNIITVPSGAWKTLRKIFKNSAIICVPLYLGKEKDVLLLYRYELLTRHLGRECVIRFLKSYGYDSLDTASVIIRLRLHYQEYMAGKRPFPHELGVILEYPVEDVESFILHEGRNCLLASYWKVYHNREQAEQIFQKYDEARLKAMREVLEGRPLELVVEKNT